MKKNELHYKPGQIPYVWVVKREYTINVFFDEKNAKDCFNEEIRRLRLKGYKLLGGESSELTYAIFENRNGERVHISVDDKTISDYKQNF